LSYHEIAIKLQIARNTVMKYYKKYKNNSWQIEIGMI
jgi:transposase